MENEIETAVKKAFDEVIVRRAFNAIQRRAEKNEKFEEMEKVFSSLLQTADCVEENVNMLLSFWQEQSYMQGLEDSRLIHEEFKKYGIH